MTASYRKPIDKIEGSGMKFEVFEFVRKTHSPVGMGMQSAPVQSGGSSSVITLQHSVSAPLVWRQIKMTLEGGSGLLEPGALQYALGSMAVSVQKHEQKSNIFSRAMASAGTGESGFATRYDGVGEVWSEPTTKYFLCASMDGPEDALLLDDKAFYACEGSIKLTTHVHRNVQGVFSGAGFMQPKMEGKGCFVVECPVPIDEVEVIELDGTQELIVDGDMMLMYSASLDVTLQPLVKGLRNMMRSGEGLVYRIKGKGVVWLTPTARMGL